MGLQGFRLRPDAPAKPAYRSPCNQCGVCCALELCSIANEYFTEAPCPALGFADGRYWCGMVAEPAKHLLTVQHTPWLEAPEAQAQVNAYLGPLIAEGIGLDQECGCPDDE